jgi:hypothetical protein
MRFKRTLKHYKVTNLCKRATFFWSVDEALGKHGKDAWPYIDFLWAIVDLAKRI